MEGGGDLVGSGAFARSGTGVKACGPCSRRDSGVGLPERHKKRPDREIWSFEFGSPGRIRTSECLSQSQVPYRLATGL